MGALCETASGYTLEHLCVSPNRCGGQILECLLSVVYFKCFFFFMCALQLTVYYRTMSLNVSLVFFASILPLEFKQTKCYQPCYNGSAYILTSTASEIHFIINNSSSILYCTVFNLFLFWHRQFFDHRLQF